MKSITGIHFKTKQLIKVDPLFPHCNRIKISISFPNQSLIIEFKNNCFDNNVTIQYVKKVRNNEFEQNYMMKHFNLQSEHPQ